MYVCYRPALIEVALETHHLEGGTRHKRTLTAYATTDDVQLHVQASPT